jgi:hypothetical protein
LDWDEVEVLDRVRIGVVVRVGLKVGLVGVGVVVRVGFSVAVGFRVAWRLTLGLKLV